MYFLLCHHQDLCRFFFHIFCSVAKKMLLLLHLHNTTFLHQCFSDIAWSFWDQSILNNLQCLYLTLEIHLKFILQDATLFYHFPKKDKKKQKKYSIHIWSSHQTSHLKFSRLLIKAKNESHQMAQSGYFIGQSLGSFFMFIPICCFNPGS